METDIWQQPMPAHLLPGLLNTPPVYMSLMEQKEEQPEMTSPSLPTRVTWMLHPVTRSWFRVSFTIYGLDEVAATPTHVPLPLISP
jgi:hypothetical protein